MRGYRPCWELMPQSGRSVRINLTTIFFAARMTKLHFVRSFGASTIASRLAMAAESSCMSFQLFPRR